MALVAGQVPVSGYRIPDYSGAAAAGGAAGAAPYQVASGLIQQAGDYFKQQGEKKKLIKQSDVQIDAALKLFPDLAPALQGYRDQLKDENLPLDERTAIADSISNVINMGIGEMRNAQSNLLKKQQLEAEADYRERMATASETRATASLLGAKQAAGELKETEISIFDPEIGKERKEKVLIDKQGQYYEPDTKRPILNKEKFFYGEEGGLGELPTTSQVGGSASDLIASAAQMNIGKLSTAKTPGTQGGNVGCADAICRTFKQATGEELVPGGTLSTRKMATTLENDPRFVKVPLDQAQKGDIVLTPRKGNKAGHTGIVLDGGAIASNSSKGFAGKAPGTFVQNYTIDSWKRNVAPRNPRETAAYRYVGSQGIDNALAMNGDMTQQAMGTPQQQAEAARQIEQGQQLNLSTAQNIPQGAIPTEPSMVAQQPQLPQPQRRMVRGIPADGGKATPVMMTSEQVRNLASQGYKVDAVPTAEGGFMVSGVTAGGQAPRYTKTPEEELQSQRLTNLDKEQAELRSAGLSAAQDISQLKQITGLLDTSVKTGFGREVIMKAKRVVGADVANEEQFQALVGNEAMKNIALTKGAISDREMEYFKTVLSPNMGKTTAGNKKIIDFKIKYAERASKIAKTITKMQSEGKSPFEIQEQVSNIIESEPIVSNSDIDSTPANQAESDANFLEGFRSGE